jgi:hypothetical protein
LPLNDYFAGLKVCLAEGKGGYFFVIIFSFIISWWIYVPLHELFHAFGCLLGGGEVRQLDISPVYGASFLKRFFPFISPGSEYAGQLTGFDTRNSDSVYLLTVFFPYMITILIGIPLLKSVVTGTSSRFLKGIKFGASLPVAYSPFISITGDYYEMGSIIVTRILSLMLVDFQVDRWRSDDVVKLSSELFFSNSAVISGDIAGISVSFLLGISLIFFTYWAGSLMAKLIVRG